MTSARRSQDKKAGCQWARSLADSTTCQFTISVVDAPEAIAATNDQCARTSFRVEIRTVRSGPLEFGCCVHYSYCCSSAQPHVGSMIEAQLRADPACRPVLARSAQRLAGLRWPASARPTLLSFDVKPKKDFHYATSAQPKRLLVYSLTGRLRTKRVHVLQTQESPTADLVCPGGPAPRPASAGSD